MFLVFSKGKRCFGVPKTGEAPRRRRPSQNVCRETWARRRPSDENLPRISCKTGVRSVTLVERRSLHLGHGGGLKSTWNMIYLSKNEISEVDQYTIPI